jgi:NADH-quinone oxidoreductase subunit L
MLNLTPLILALPLAGFVVLGLLGRALPRAVISLIGCGTVLAAFVCAVADFFSMVGQPADARTADATLWTWVQSGALHITFGLLSDPLSAVMLLIVTGVGFLIHVYAVGYMADDPGYWRFFSFLNLFVFAMALLVAADSFLFLLVGWAGVGLASFLLIGFWYTRPAAVAAATKALVVNVIGDFGLMLAIFLLFKNFGTLQYSAILGQPFTTEPCVHLHTCPHFPLSGALYVDTTVVLAICLLLFVAAAAKSAQLPLHVWLPDAMEGPTPVSALIHAATMVTAGVYLVARAAPLFRASQTSLIVVGIIGAGSALFAATIACVQTDIKRVLAYSTMSQLGYMFLGESAGGFSSGIFHLTTHAYFKALLFMCAGAVIHALAGEQDMRKMGGLRALLPRTFALFVVGGLALAAIFPFAGFWSKDAVLGAALQRSTAGDASAPLWLVLYIVGLVTALLTGFYTFRLIFGVFLGQYRGGEIGAGHGGQGTETGERRGAAASGRDPLARVHEVGPAMLVPMLVLGILSLVGGFYGVPGHNWLGDFLAPVTGATVEPSSAGLTALGMALSLVAGLAGIGLAWVFYGQRQASFAPSRNPLVVFLQRRWYVDDLYDRVIVRPLLWIGRILRRSIEGVALDGGGRATGDVIRATSSGLRALQTGYVRNYALAILVGAALILLYYVIHP